MEFLGKKYKLDTSENFDEYLKAIGVGLISRKMANSVTPVVDLQKDGDEYILSNCSTFKNFVVKFKPGVEYDQDTPDGRKIKSTLTLDGNALTEVQSHPGGKVATITREFSDSEVKMVLKIDNITATRIYKIQA